MPLKGVPQTRSWKVSARRGGLLEWAEVGLVVIVPPKAISGSEMTLTVTAMPGAVVAYEFGPHGSQFAAPLIVTQSLVGTNYARLGADVRLRGGYFRNASQINHATGTAEIDESLPTVLGFKGLFVSFKVTHFSGYMVSTD